MTTDELVRDHLERLASTVRTERPALSTIVEFADHIGPATSRSAHGTDPTDQRDAGRRGRVAVLAVAAVLAAAAVVTLAVVDRTDAPTRPAAAPTTAAATTTTTRSNIEQPTGLVAYPDTWTSVEPGAGLVAWYRLDDVAAERFTAAEIGPAAVNASCSDWTASAGPVTCNSISLDGFLPSVAYSGVTGSVEISTMHADMTAAEYATAFSTGKDTGYDDPPLQPAPVDIDGRTGQLIDLAPAEPSAVRRITVQMAPGVLVAVESNGLSVDELVELTAQLEPAAPAVETPLLLASTGGDGVTAQLHGALVDGEVCALSPLWFNSGPLACTLLGHDTIHVVASGGAPVYTGLVNDEVAAIVLRYDDGTTATIAPTPQPVGTTQAFAIATPRAVAAIDALDANGTELASVDLDPTMVVVPTTAFSPDTPASAAPSTSITPPTPTG